MQTQVTFTSEEAKDVLCTAIEGGINYWVDYIKVLESEQDQYGIKNYLRVEIVTDDNPKVKKVISWEDMERGANLFLAAHPDTFAARYILDGAIDVEAADVIVQMACFGEVIYG